MQLYISVEKRVHGRFVAVEEFTKDEDFIIFAFETFPDEFVNIMTDLYLVPDLPFDQSVKGSYVEHQEEQFVIARHWWMNKALSVESPEDRIVGRL